MVKLEEMIKEEGEKLCYQPLDPAIFRMTMTKKCCKITFGTDVIKKSTTEIDNYFPLVIWFKKETYEKLKQLSELC